MDSYAKFMELAMKPKETGAYLRQSVFYFKDKVHVKFSNLSNLVYTYQNYCKFALLRICSLLVYIYSFSVLEKLKHLN